MVIFGGLEIIAGGYLVHRYHKKKNLKKKLEEDARHRRHNSFPGTTPPSYPHSHPPQHAPIPQHKYACHAPQPRPQPPYPQHRHTEPRPHRHTEPRPHQQHHVRPVTQGQPFMIPRRPLPQQQPPLIIQPLQRADSMATISRMPIANGFRPSNLETDAPRPPRLQASNLSPIPQSPMNYPYGNAGFAVSSPALGHSPMTPTYGAGSNGGRQTVDDNWETYNQPPGHATHYAPSESTALGEDRDDDPPPPYRP